MNDYLDRATSRLSREELQAFLDQYQLTQREAEQILGLGEKMIGRWLTKTTVPIGNLVNVQLAYYPPYHSKYNPIERVFGVLENYWNGDPLRSLGMVLGMAEGMTYKKVHPKARFYKDTYPIGVKLNKKAMKPLRRFGPSSI